MVALTSLVTTLLFAASVTASPVQRPDVLRLPIIPTGLLCNVPMISRLLCPRASTTKVTIVTKLGVASGVASGSAYRYSVRYGSANRWQPPTMASLWQLPNSVSDPSALPLACPQSGVDPSVYSEDCLSMVLYVPKTVKIGSNVPTMVWFHGGSFIQGSASGPGLDGSNLAVASNAIVAVVQYRLGALGFLSPNSNSNLGVQDAVLALQFLNNVLPSIGGIASKVTIAGQSAGGHMVRALLATPSASSLFASAIMQSDPMTYGFYTPSIQQMLNNDFVASTGCSSSDTACLNKLSVSAILDAQGSTCGNAGSLSPAANGGEPLRPVRDGTLITTPLDLTTAFPAASKPVLISTVKNEAAYSIYLGYTDPVPAEYFETAVSYGFDSQRTTEIVDSTNYAVPATGAQGDADVRPMLEALGTDANWKCPAWSFARAWTGAGGNAYVGEYALGASYPGNSDASICTQAGIVCHQDDIEIVFGTVPGPSAAQAALVKEVQARYAAFLKTGNPNAAGYATWGAATTSAVPALLLGGSGLAPVGACTPGYWGVAPQYDYQYYHL